MVELKGKTKTKACKAKKTLLKTENSIKEFNNDEFIRDFCCETLKEYIFLENSPIAYLTPTRSYILVVSNDLTLDIEYCPCCGKKLPEDLTDELTIMLEQLKIPYEDPKLPIEFKSDRWWKTLGL